MPTRHQIVITRYDGAVYTHRVLMRTCEVFLEQARQTKKGSYFNALSATLFGWMAFEAYLNTVIEHLDPDVFSDERSHFRGKTYGGALGKLRWILEKLDLAPKRRIAKRRHVIVALHRLRNQVVHAGPVRYKGEIRHSIDVDRPFMEDAWIEARVKVPQVRRYVGAVRDLCEWINSAIAPPFADPHLRVGAFEGTMQSQTSHGAVVRGRAPEPRAIARRTRGR